MRPRRDAAPRSLRELAHREKFLSPAAHELLGAEASQLLEVANERLLQRARRGFVVDVRAANGLRHDLVDHAELHQLGRGDAQCLRRSLLHLVALAVLPEDGRTALDGDDRVDGVLEHQHAVRNAERERAARPALADHRRDDRYLETAHLEEVASDRLRLSALLRAQAGPRARRVDERDDRDLVLLRQLHQPKRLAIALGMRHSEIAPEIFLRVAAALVADDHHRIAVEARPPTHDRSVVAVETVAVELDAVREGELEVVEGERPPRIARDLHALQRGEARVDGAPELIQLALERHDLLFHAQLTLFRRASQLIDRLFELHNRRAHASAPADESNALGAEQRAQIRKCGVGDRDPERLRTQSRAGAIAIVPPELDRRRAGVCVDHLANIVHHVGRDRSAGRELDRHGDVTRGAQLRERGDRLDDEGRIVHLLVALGIAALEQYGNIGLDAITEQRPGLRKDEHFRRSRKILHCQPRELGTAPLAHLLLEGRHDHAQVHGCLHPAAEGRDAVRRKDFYLRAEGLQGVPGDVEAENLLLLREALAVAPGRDVRQRARELRAWRLIAGGKAEERALATRRLILFEPRLLQRGIERREKLRAMAAERVERAGCDHRLEDALVAQPQVDAIAEIEERREGRIRARSQDRVDRGTADIANRAKAEAHALVADDGELVSRLVDVGGQHFDRELARLVDVFHHGVRIADLR